MALRVCSWWCLAIVSLLCLKCCAHRRMSAQWAVELRGTDTAELAQRAKQIAREHGMVYKGLVRNINLMSAFFVKE